MKKQIIPNGFEAVSHTDIRRIVSRLHVRSSIFTVCREVRRALKWKTSPHMHRRYALAAAIQEHARNIWEYKYVMGSVPRKYPTFRPRYYFNRETLKTIIIP